MHSGGRGSSTGRRGRQAAIRPLAPSPEPPPPPGPHYSRARCLGSRPRRCRPRETRPARCWRSAGLRAAACCPRGTACGGRRGVSRPRAQASGRSRGSDRVEAGTGSLALRAPWGLTLQTWADHGSDRDVVTPAWRAHGSPPGAPASESSGESSGAGRGRGAPRAGLPGGRRVGLALTHAARGTRQRGGPPSRRTSSQRLRHSKEPFPGAAHTPVSRPAAPEVEGDRRPGGSWRKKSGRWRGPPLRAPRRPCHTQARPAGAPQDHRESTPPDTGRPTGHLLSNSLGRREGRGERGGAVRPTF